ncbi:glycosyltransferase [Micromonospora sp. NBC_01796]|uniref:glycosyltransferase n=1 Tax=Micromonospora sp. NBC_01796 TaxID=2975987 RepID=UPI002DDB585A|nr:glycosyltransferase [Micromonospora sp. NBC_01796]WSA87975.1 glycosyltransferase [Micromonospora sp. NBC_01796]
MSSKDTPEMYSHWRLVIGDRRGLRRRRWPVAMMGSGLTEVPGRSGGRPAPGPGDQVGRVAIAAESVDWLRHLLDHPFSLVHVRRVTVVVDSWRIPQGGWSGRLGAIRHVLAHRTRFPRTGEGRAMVDIEVRWSTPLRSVLAAVIPLFTPVRALPQPASADVTAQDVLPAWLGGGQNTAVVSGALPENNDIRAHDLVLTASGEPRPLEQPAVTETSVVEVVDSAVAAPTPADLYATTLAANPYGAGAASRPATVLVDLERSVVQHRYGPFGRSAGRAELTFTDAEDGWGYRLTGPDGPLCEGRIDRPWFGEEALAALVSTGVVHCARVPARHPVAEAAFLVHLVLAGLLVHVPGLPDEVGVHLADEVRDALREDLPARSDDDLEWEVRAVALRRSAMRLHASGFTLPRLAATTFPSLTAVPSVSALLVTKRLQHVIEAVNAIENQTYPNLEIVLCLHGVEVPAELRARVARSSRPIEIMTLPPEHGFGEAIGAATARARGSLVTKFDDDDTYGPEHVWDLVLARHYSGATLVGKGAEFVYLQTLDTTVRRDVGLAEEYISVVAGGTMLISRGDLEQVGGWRPVPRSIDRGLLDRVRRSGGLIYRTHPLGYVYQRRSDGHTWDPGLEYFLRGAGMQWSGLPRHREFGTESSLTGLTGLGVDQDTEPWVTHRR